MHYCHLITKLPELCRGCFGESAQDALQCVSRETMEIQRADDGTDVGASRIHILAVKLPNIKVANIVMQRINGFLTPENHVISGIFEHQDCTTEASINFSQVIRDQCLQLRRHTKLQNLRGPGTALKIFL